MKLNSLFILSLTLTIFSCSPPRLFHSKLLSAWPKNASTSGCSVGNGLVYLKNDTAVAGTILFCLITNEKDSLNTDSASIEVLPIGKTKKEDIKNIYYKDIDNIRIEDKLNADSAKFKPFGGILAMLLGKKNNIELYCWYGYSVSWSNGEDITERWAELILTDNEKVSDEFVTFRQPTERWLDYAKFVNKRYGEHLSKYYFKGKDVRTMIKYVLDKENERQKNGSNP